MLTQPSGVLQAYGLPPNIQYVPVPQGNWYMIAKEKQAAKVLALAKANLGAIAADFTLVRGSQDGEAPYLLFPYPNPTNMDVWIIKGTVTAASGTLVMDDYAGSVFDRGPASEGFGGQPQQIDNNGAYGPLGGKYLTVADGGSGQAVFKWSDEPQQPIS